MRKMCGFPSVVIPIPAIWSRSLMQRGVRAFHPDPYGRRVLRSSIFPWLYRGCRLDPVA